MRYPAAAGGDVPDQLRHLRGHLAFQRQTRSETLRLDWNAVITRAQSRLHVTRELHRKINAKAGGETPDGRNLAPEVQKRLVRLGRMHRRRERVSPGDLLGIGGRLRERIRRTCRSMEDE